ncbi:MAG: tripartite tricarboxylate transporter TctB family protein [Deltaproteobacteria bacterium]|nr:MAG: tripartite tricarboxylate transporter TctB family protein [Deltaproteobacteria bacterium]
MKFKIDALIGFLVIVLSSLILVVLIPTIPHDILQTGRASLSPKFFPTFIGITMMVFGFILIIVSYLAPSVGKESVLKIGKKELLRVFLVTFTGLFYVILIYLMSYLIPTVVVLAFLLWLYGENRWAVIFPLTIGVSLAMFYLFGRVLMLMMPQGILF